MILLVLFTSLDGEISGQTSSIFHGIRIDSTSVSGTISGRTCCCWTGMSRPALCATGLCLRRKPAAAGITTTSHTQKTGNNSILTTGITSKDMMSRQTNKFLHIPKLKKTMKRENVLSMMAGVVLGVCAMLLFSRNNSQPSTNKLDSAQTQTILGKPATSTAESKPFP